MNHNATTPADLAHALIAIGAERCSLPDVSPECFQRLAELGLSQFESGEWELTAAGRKVLPVVMEGDLGVFQ